LLISIFDCMLSSPARSHITHCIGVGLLALVFLLSSPVASPVQAQDTSQARSKQVVDRIVAVVGDEIVLKSDVDQMVAQMLQQQRGASYSDELWMQALDRMVDENILIEQARRDTNITATDEMVEQQLDSWIEQNGGPEQLEQAFGMDILEVREEMTPQIRNQILAQQLQRQKLNTIEVTPSEVQQWFQEQPQDSLPRQPESVRISHIVRYPEMSEAARKEARSILKTIRDSIVNAGASFEEMAKQFSDDTGSAREGGAIEGLPLDAFVADFAAVAARTPIGEVSRIFYNPQHKGYHIIRVNDRRGDIVDLNHILIRVDQSRAEASPAIEYLEAVRDTLVNNPDVPFELMAKRHSEEERSKRNGGRVTDPQTGIRDLALQRLGPSWQRTINSIEVGEISEPSEVNLLNGERAYHIVLLQRRLPPHRINLEQDYELVRQAALREKQQRVMDEWLSELRDEIFVDIRVDEDDLTATR
jgi:peptidyl-prolyl cis-trans isomerase SurA